MPKKLDLPEQEICRLYETGIGCGKLAKIYSCDKSTILEMIRRHGIGRTLQQAMKLRVKMSPEERRQRTKVWKKTYLEKHKERLSTEEKLRRKTDSSYALKKNMRARVYFLLKGYQKSKSTLGLLGCADIEQLKTHLERQFTDGMSWENYGQWHVDHIRPCAAFDLSKAEEQQKCFHYTNLQPLWAEDNLSKGAK